MTERTKENTFCNIRWHFTTFLASCTWIVSETLRKVPRLVGEDVESGKRRQRVPDNLRDTWFTTVPTKVYQHFYNFTFMSTSVPRFLHLWPHLLTLVAHPSFNILLILCSQKEFGQWLLSQRDLWRLCQWAAFSGKQREDLGRKHNYHFSASIAIFFGHFPLWRESWWIPASYCGCKFRAEVSFSQFGIFWARCLFLRRGAFYGGEKADERVVASYLAAKPPLSLLCRHP